MGYEKLRVCGKSERIRWEMDICVKIEPFVLAIPTEVAIRFHKTNSGLRFDMLGK